MSTSSPSPIVLDALNRAMFLNECIEAIWQRDVVSVGLFSTATESREPLAYWNAENTPITQLSSEGWAIDLSHDASLTLKGPHNERPAIFDDHEDSIRHALMRCYKFEMAMLKAEAYQKLSKRPDAITIIATANGTCIDTTVNWEQHFGWTTAQMANEGWQKKLFPDIIYRHTTRELIVSPKSAVPGKPFTVDVETSSGESLPMNIKREWVIKPETRLSLMLIHFEMNCEQQERLLVTENVPSLIHNLKPFSHILI